MGAAPDWVPLEPDAAKALAKAQQFLIGYLRRYHRWELDGHFDVPTDQVLFVANHGFGGLFDLNVAALFAVNRLLDVRRPTTVLVHQIAWSTGLGPVIERFYCRPASREAAEDGFARGHHVLVLPGGDVDAFKPHRERNNITFAGRSGFARLAMEAGVPIVPVVTSGAGNSLYVFSDGKGLAKAFGLSRRFRLSTLPVSLSFPWGLSVGVVGLLPYVPLPSKLRTRVLPPMVPAPDESAADFADRVASAMQAALDELVSA